MILLYCLNSVVLKPMTEPDPFDSYNCRVRGGPNGTDVLLADAVVVTVPLGLLKVSTDTS
jgi:hypothetical protein